MKTENQFFNTAPRSLSSCPYCCRQYCDDAMMANKTAWFDALVEHVTKCRHKDKVTFINFNNIHSYAKARYFLKLLHKQVAASLRRKFKEELEYSGITKDDVKRSRYI